MKNLSYFLWLCVVVLAGCVGFDILFHNYLKENDLLSIKQNQRCFEVIKNSHSQIHKGLLKYSKEQAFSIKDTIIIAQSQYIVNYIQKNIEDTTHLFQNAPKTVAWVALQDTSLRDLNQPLIDSSLNHPLQSIFEKNYLLHIQTILRRVSYKVAERFTHKVGGVYYDHNLPRIYVLSENKHLMRNEEYEAQFFIAKNKSYSNPKVIWLSEGRMTKYKGEKYVIIPSVKVKKFPPNNRLKKTLQGCLVLKQAWNRDTILCFSTTYTVKRKK